MSKKFILVTLCLLYSAYCSAQISFTQDSVYVFESYNYVAAGDLNNDSLDDIILGTISFPVLGFFPDSLEQVIEVYHQTNSHTFNLIQRIKYDTLLGYSLNSIEIADMNNDGLKDIVISHGNAVAIYAQDSTFHFQLAYEFVRPIGIIEQMGVIKLYQDSLESIIVSYFSNYLLLLRPTSVFTFDTLELHPPTFDSFEGFAIGDFNSDSLMDIAAKRFTAFGSNPAFIFYQDSVNGFSSTAIPLDTVSAFGRCNSIGAGDLNNDNLTDIIATFGGNLDPSIGIYYQDTTNQTVKYLVDTIANVIDIPSEIQVRDLNQNGLNDLLVLHDGWAALSIFEQMSNGDIVFDSAYFDFRGSTHIDTYAFIDLNGDHKIDIISVAAGEIKFYYNTSTAIGISPIEGNYGLQFSLYPNPARDNLFIRTNGAFESSDKLKSIAVVNSLGQKFDLDVIQLNKFEYKINTQTLTNGLYFLLIETTKHRGIRRFIKYE